MIEVFTLFGAITIMAVSILAIMLTISCLGNFIAEKKYEHKITHRFDKTPTAKCYCKDCRSWDKINEHCGRFDIFTEDCGFCWRAEPRKRELVKN